MSGSSSKQSSSIYDFTVKDIRGNDVDLSVYKGKVLLIVNVASQCGLPNSIYPELDEVYTKYKDLGLEILDCPCNQFGGEEPGDNSQIAEVSCTHFKLQFPIFDKFFEVGYSYFRAKFPKFDKVEVNGNNAAPLYKLLKSSKCGSSKSGLCGDGIKCNFTKFLSCGLLGGGMKWNKFLVDRDGNVVERYAPTASPFSIEKDVKKLLGIA